MLKECSTRCQNMMCSLGMPYLEDMPCNGHGKEAHKILDGCVKKLYLFYLVKLGKLVCPWKTIFLKLAQGWTASCKNAHQKVNVMPPLTKIHQVNATFCTLIQIGRGLWTI